MLRLLRSRWAGSRALVVFQVGEGCLVNTYVGWGRFERVRSRHDGQLL